MENVLLPSIAAMQPHRILDVGVERYSAHYRELFTGCDYWTIDRNPTSIVHSGGNRHVIADVRQVRDHFPANSFDVVLLNGIFGYGVDDLEEQEVVIGALRSVLTVGGWLITGWDRDADGKPLVQDKRGRLREPPDLVTIEQFFAHRAPVPLPARQEFMNCSHVFDWFQRVI